MTEENKYKLEQVSVRLRLNEEMPLYSDKIIDTPNRAIEVMKEMMKELDRENVCIVNLDGANHPINFNIVSIGSVNSSMVTIRELFKSAIMSNAASIMLLHNHPSAHLSPSREDHTTTARVMMAADLMGIPLIDHIIVGGVTGEYFSYKNFLNSKFNLEGIRNLLKINHIETDLFSDCCASKVCENKTATDSDDSRQEDYKPLAKVEELEEQNYNMIDNRLNNLKPKAEERKEQRQEEDRKVKDQANVRERRSVVEQLNRNKAKVDEKKAGKKEEKVLVEVK